MGPSASVCGGCSKSSILFSSCEPTSCAICSRTVKSRVVQKCCHHAGLLTYSDTLVEFATRDPPRTILDHTEGMPRAVDGNRQTGGSTSLLLLTGIHHKVVADLSRMNTPIAH